MNSADLYNVTDLNNGTITYNRMKTKERRLDGAKMQVNVPRLILPLIEKYRDSTGKRIFNFYKYYSNEKIFNKAINYGLTANPKGMWQDYFAPFEKESKIFNAEEVGTSHPTP